MKDQVLNLFSVEPTPSFGSDHLYSMNFTKETPEYKDQACQTTLTVEEIDRLYRLEENKNILLRDALVDIVTKDDTRVKKYTGVPSKSQLDGMFGKFYMLAKCVLRKKRENIPRVK